MPKITPFQQHVEQYEKWFIENKWVYAAELKAVKSLLPLGEKGVEIGVGTGRFAGPLGIKIGVEPAIRMRTIAQQRGIEVIDGIAENLPFNNAEFDFVLMVTTVCFLDDVFQAFQEAFRVLKEEGYLVVAFVDRNSPVGQIYSAKKSENVFYKDATFYSVNEVVDTMKKSGFSNFQLQQTILKNLQETTINEPVMPGYGKGSFVVVRGKK